MNWQYYGLFLDNNTRNYLLDKINAITNSHIDFNIALNVADKIYLDHCTLLHKSQCNVGNTKVLNTLLLLSPNFTIKMAITHIGISKKAMAFKVEEIDNLCANKIPHITIATFNNGKPVDSNDIKDWYELDEKFYIVGILKRV